MTLADQYERDAVAADETAERIALGNFDGLIAEPKLSYLFRYWNGRADHLRAVADEWRRRGG